VTTYKCKECDEEFEHKVNCITHHMLKKHEKFEILGSQIEINIKTPKKE
jgi:hypothetical protein